MCATLPTLIAGAGTADDRLRLLLLLELHPGGVPPAEVEGYEATLKEAGIDLSPKAYVRQMRAFQQSVATARPAEANPSTAGGRVFSRMMQVRPP